MSVNEEKVLCTPSEENTLLSKGYKLTRLIGEGTYARVYLAEYTGSTTRTQLACKIVDTSRAARDFVVKFLPRELDILIRLNHPHLVHIHSIFQRKSKYYIFMRNGENGDLLTYILRNGCTSENQTRVWIRQLALGLEYLHAMEIAHRDLKCENVLITANFNVKITDFGFARYCVDFRDNPILSTTYCGSMSYAAPEILRGRPYSPKYTDLWSLGVVFFVMLSKSMPFDDTRMKKLYEQQMNKKYKFRGGIGTTLSTECKALLHRLLEPDIKLRATASEVVHSDWISMDPRLSKLSEVESAALKRARDRRKLGELSVTKIVIPQQQIESAEVNDNFFDDDREVKLSPSELVTLSSRGYTINRKLNEGSYAKVYIATFCNPVKPEKSSTLACKIIDTQTAPKDFCKKFLPREIEMLIKLNHPHLVHTHSIFQRRFKYFIFMRYMEKGDLLDYIVENGVVIEDQARIWTRQLGLAIQYMHALDIAHRDIKCENVLITANQNVKLSDFGFARVCVDSKMRPVHSETFCGSVSYTAPEILQGLPYMPKPTDVWSLGVVLYVMLNRSMPFEDKNIKQLHEAQLNRKWKFRSRYEDTITEQCKTAVGSMMEPSVAYRTTIDDLIAGDWIAMDPRLMVWSSQEQSAIRKAREEAATKLNDCTTRKELVSTRPSIENACNI